MKAAVYENYGPPEVLKIAEVEPPELGAGDEARVLVAVHSVSLNPFDVFFRRGYYPIRITNGLLRPKVRRTGADLAGTIAAVGEKVEGFEPGDRVFGFGQGACAELVRSRPGILARIPANLTFSEAAALPTVAVTALEALRDVAGVRPGQQVLVYGASGGVGHLAVQLAKFFGAEVTAVCSTANLGWVRDLGAAHVIDYTREDFAAQGRKYDLILDAVGKRTFFNTRRALKSEGMYITEHILYPKYHILQFLLGSLFGDRRARTHLSRENAEGLEFIRARVDEGSVRPVIEKTFPLDRIAEAHRHAETGHTKGKVVVTIRE